MARPQIPQRKISRIALKPRNPQKFSPSKVSRYTVVAGKFAPDGEL